MDNKERFVAYEYKNITVRRDTAAMHADCLHHFGWALVEEYEHGYDTGRLIVPHHVSGTSIPAHVTQMPADRPAGIDMVTLQFKRDRRLDHRLEINTLEQKCESELAAIEKLERKSSARLMGISLGVGIMGSLFLGLAAYQFVSASAVLGIIFSIIGLAGWGVGFYANQKIAQSQSTQTQPMIQAHMSIVYSTCEQAHDLLGQAA